MRCQANTKLGKRCARNAGDSGFCTKHDTRTPGEKAQTLQKKLIQQTRFEEVIEVIEHACKAKSWGMEIDSADETNHRYATVSVWQQVGVDTVRGQLDLTVNDGMSFTLIKTSFYSYGLDALRQAIMIELERLPWLEKPKKNESSSRLDVIKNILNKFDAVANQLRRRYGGRDTLKISDEYDVQDLLQALLKVHFDDIRPEEYSPSKAGASSRLDFLLKNEKIVIEVKMANTSLTDKKLGEQLIIDIERYKAHPDCQKLICMIYDPEHHIRNPIGLEKDLSRKEQNLEVVVVIVPK